MKSYHLFLLTAILISSLHLSAQTDQDPFYYADSDGDGTLNRAEYGVAWERAKAFDYWDSDDDGLIENEEYSSGVRERYDYDRNQNLSRGEWDRSTPWSEDLGTYETYDLNGDNNIDEDEWNEGVKSFSYDEAYDADGDGSLNQREYTDMTYDSSDMDRDGSLSEDEFNENRPHWVDD
jgi:hypothetical protein